MQLSASVTAVSWIPAGTVEGMARVPFSLAITHYDERPPSRMGDLNTWLREDRFREANYLKAWIEVEDARIVAAGYAGPGGLLGSTLVKLGAGAVRVPGSARPIIRRQPWVSGQTARFVQTVGGRTGVPFPRPTRRPPFVAWHSSTAWTTLELILHVDGRAEGRLLGASPFPCHFVYGADGELAAETGATDFRTWFTACFGRHTPWGGHELEPLRLHEVAPALAEAS